MPLLKRWTSSLFRRQFIYLEQFARITNWNKYKRLPKSLTTRGFNVLFDMMTSSEQNVLWICIFLHNLMSLIKVTFTTSNRILNGRHLFNKRWRSFNGISDSENKIISSMKFLTMSHALIWTISVSKKSVDFNLIQLDVPTFAGFTSHMM